MENNQIDEVKSTRKRPVFLLVLLVLTSISLVMALYNVLSSFIKGPLNEEELEFATATLYKSMEQIQDQGIDGGLMDLLQKTIDYIIYVNNETFYLNSIMELLTILVGGISVYFLYNLRKIGFHLYVLYSFLPVLTMYLIVPAELVMGVIIIWYVFIAALFCILYGLNLKHMK